MADCHYVKICMRTLRDYTDPRCDQQPLTSCRPLVLDRTALQNAPQNIPNIIPAPVKPVKYCHCRYCGRPVKETGWRKVQKFSPQCACGSKEFIYDTGTEPEVDGADDT